MTKNKTQPFPREISEYLGNYVYALADPRDNAIFYVGKGKGDRILAHEKEAKEDKEIYTAKHKRIQAIEEAGLEVSRHFLRIQIKASKEALAVEQGAISALKLAGLSLTNLVSGQGGVKLGETSFEQVLADVLAEPLPAINEPTLIFKINNMWSYGMDDAAVGQVVNGFWWSLAPKSRSEARLAIAVAFGIVRGVYWIEPNSWHQGNRLGGAIANRWGFKEKSAKEYSSLIGKHVRHLNKKGAAGSYRVYLDGYPGPVEQ